MIENKLSIHPDILDVETGIVELLYFVNKEIVRNSSVNAKININTLYKLFLAFNQYCNKYFNMETHLNLLQSKTLFEMEIERLINEGIIRRCDKTESIFSIFGDAEDYVCMTNSSIIALANHELYQKIKEFKTYKFISFFCNDYGNLFRYSELFGTLDFDPNKVFEWEYI